MKEQRITELIKKLKALAERGIGGEKLNAERLLRELMQKHNISEEDLDSTERISQYLKVQVKKIPLFAQVVASVLGEARVMQRRDKPSVITLECTDLELMEITTKFEFYWLEFKDQEKLFFKAFVLKNNLVGNKTRSMDELSAKEILELSKVNKLMNGIRKSIFNKRLSPKMLNENN